jgi:hypothetical protein
MHDWKVVLCNSTSRKFPSSLYFCRFLTQCKGSCLVCSLHVRYLRVTASGVNPHQIACIGISAQRSSFVTWHRETGEPFHNFITWRDLRADGLVQQWNKSLTMRVCLTELCLRLLSDAHNLALGALCLSDLSRS